MDRFAVLILVFIGCMCSVPGHAEEITFSTKCKVENAKDFPREVCEDPSCATAIKSHIKHEFDAAFKYMYMASYFAQDRIDRPGLAKFLFEAASEERGHAIQMLDYLNLRGIMLNDMDYNFNDTLIPETLSYQSALKEAINMEIQVTKLIYNVVSKCEKDYHGADVFTNPILDEQHDGVRKLQGAYRTFLDLKHGHEEAFAEYIFDRKMLSGDI